MEWHVNDAQDTDFNPRIISMFSDDLISAVEILFLWQSGKTAELRQDPDVTFIGSGLEEHKGFTALIEPERDSNGNYHMDLDYTKNTYPSQGIWRAFCVPQYAGDDEKTASGHVEKTNSDSGVMSLDYVMSASPASDEHEYRAPVEDPSLHKNEKPWDFPHCRLVDSDNFRDLVEEEFDVSGSVLYATDEEKQRLVKIFGVTVDDITAEDEDPETTSDGVHTMAYKILDISLDDFIWVARDFLRLNEDLVIDGMEYIRMRDKKDNDESDDHPSE
jgi:hypothetical protein